MLADFIIPNALWQSLTLTLRLALITTALLAVIGLPLAQWLNTSRLKFIAVIETLLLAGERQRGSSRPLTSGALPQALELSSRC